MRRLARIFDAFRLLDPGHTARWALIVLAVVLLLNAADPTARFIGILLPSEQGRQAPGSPSTHCGDDGFALPDAVSARAGARTVLAQLCLSLPATFVSPGAGPFSLSGASSPARHAQALPGRNGPPLRC